MIMIMELLLCFHANQSGGVMTANEALIFESGPYFRECVEMRQMDEAAKEVRIHAYINTYVHIYTGWPQERAAVIVSCSPKVGY